MPSVGPECQNFRIEGSTPQEPGTAANVSRPPDDQPPVGVRMSWGLSIARAVDGGSVAPRRAARRSEGCELVPQTATLPPRPGCFSRGQRQERLPVSGSRNCEGVAPGRFQELRSRNRATRRMQLRCCSSRITAATLANVEFADIRVQRIRGFPGNQTPLSPASHRGKPPSWEYSLHAGIGPCRSPDPLT